MEELKCPDVYTVARDEKHSAFFSGKIKLESDQISKRKAETLFEGTIIHAHLLHFYNMERTKRWNVVRLIVIKVNFIIDIVIFMIINVVNAPETSSQA